MNDPVINAVFAQLFRGLGIRPVTRGLVQNVLLDLPLSPAQATDFGIDSDDHYRAVRAVLTSEAPTPLKQIVAQLDAAYGNGKRLNNMVKRYAPAYADHVQFYTSWDVLYGRSKNN